MSGCLSTPGQSRELTGQKLDVVSAYPNVSQLLNISRKTCAMEFSRMKGVTDHHRREVGVNLTGGKVNAMEICEKILKAPSLDTLLSGFMQENGLEGEIIDERYIETRDPVKEERVVETEVRDDSVMAQLVYTWVNRAGYEVSTKGDKRFSALVARLKDGRTVEEAYQLDVKQWRRHGNDWRLGKGKPPLVTFEGDDLYLAYRDLWIQWTKENPDLIAELKTLADQHEGQLSDCFAHGRPVNQARALADILNDNI